MTQSQQIARQAVAQVIPTRRSIVRTWAGVWAVLLVMLACGASLVALVLSTTPAQATPEQLTPAELAAFEAGREAAYSEMAGYAVEAFEAGKREACAGRQP